jgi:hypothetical protein
MKNPGTIPGLLFTEKIIFSHPDFTVGSGISPDRALRLRANGWAILPPVGNFTLPRRLYHAIFNNYLHFKPMPFKSQLLLS